LEVVSPGHSIKPYALLDRERSEKDSSFFEEAGVFFVGVKVDDEN